MLSYLIYMDRNHLFIVQKTKIKIQESCDENFIFTFGILEVISLMRSDFVLTPQEGHVLSGGHSLHIETYGRIVDTVLFSFISYNIVVFPARNYTYVAGLIRFLHKSVTKCHL